MKAYRGRRYLAPHILKFDTRWMILVTLIARTINHAMSLHNNFTTPHLHLQSAPQTAVNFQYDPYRSCDMFTGAAVHTEPTDGHRALHRCLISHVMSDR